MMTQRSAVMGAVLVAVLGVSAAAEARQYIPPQPTTPWVIESAEYTGEISERIARMEGVLKIRVFSDGWVEVPLGLPRVTMTKVHISRGGREAYIIPRDGQYVLGTEHKGTYTVRLTFSVRLTQDSLYEGIVFGIPQATYSTLTLAVPRKHVELRESDQLYVERQTLGDGVVLTASLAAGTRIDVRWTTKPTAPIQVEPILYGTVSTLVVLEQQLAQVTTMIDYRITQGEVRALALQIPKGMEILNVRGAGIDDWTIEEHDGHDVLHVKLTFAMKDTTYQLVIEGEETLTENQGSYQFPEVVLTGVKQERGQLAVATAGSLEIEPGEAHGLTRIDVRELSPTLRQATVFPILLAFRYHQHPYQVALAVTHYEDLPVLNAIAEQGEVITILSRQGEILTRAAYAVRANKRQFLGVLLPDGATLWSCIVDGRAVKPVKGDGGQLLVPLATGKGTERPILVELVYFEQQPALARFGHLTLHGPVLDIPTTIANWFVYTPSQIKLLHTSGNLERGASVVEFVEEPFRPVMLASALFRGNGNREISAESFGRGKGKAVARIVGQKSASEIGWDDREREENGSSLDSLGENAKARGMVAGFFAQDRAASGPSDNYKQGRTQHANTRRVDVQVAMQEMAKRMQDAGILPLKIRLPKAGSVHRFHRLMTAQESLQLEIDFVNLPMGWLPFVGLGLLLSSCGGVAVWRFRKS